MLPQDPAILISFLNLKLRDQYSSLSDLCDDIDEDEAELLKRLSNAGYRYDPETNQIR